MTIYGVIVSNGPATIYTWGKWRYPHRTPGWPHRPWKKNLHRYGR